MDILHRCVHAFGVLRDVFHQQVQFSDAEFCLQAAAVILQMAAVFRGLLFGLRGEVVEALQQLLQVFTQREVDLRAALRDIVGIQLLDMFILKFGMLLQQLFQCTVQRGIDAGYILVPDREIGRGECGMMRGHLLQGDACDLRAGAAFMWVLHPVLLGRCGPRLEAGQIGRMAGSICQGSREMNSSNLPPAVLGSSRSL